MIILFKLVILTVIIVMALKIALSKGMIFEKVGDWLEAKVDAGYKIFDLFICEWCMPTLQVFTAHAFAFGLGILPFEFNWQLVIRWPLVVFASSFVSGNLFNLYLTINRIKEKNDAESIYYKNLNDEIENSKQENNDK